MFGLSWRCSECRHSNTVLFKGKLKRELKEELEDGIEVECCYCQTEKELNESNATIIKSDDF